MWPLLASAVLLSYGLVYRWVLLRRGTGKGLEELVSSPPERSGRGFLITAAWVFRRIIDEKPGNLHTRLELAVSEAGLAASRYRMLVKTITILAPLAGLLGTVSGMIEMFESLEHQVFYSRDGGVANGISQALFTTQLGLAIAIPGMIVGKILERRERALMEEISLFTDKLCPRKGEVPG